MRHSNAAVIVPTDAGSRRYQPRPAPDFAIITAEMPFKQTRQQLKHYHRYAGYDYSRGAALFITISTDPRRRVFGDVIDGEMNLNELGREVDRSITFAFSTAPDIILYNKKVLPDHCHFRIFLS